MPMEWKIKLPAVAGFPEDCCLKVLGTSPESQTNSPEDLTTGRSQGDMNVNMLALF